MMDAPDWQTGKSHNNSMKYILEKELNTDITFLVGKDGSTVKAHKLILTARSAVFERMFNGSFGEPEKPTVIPEVTASAFMTVLRYCYYEYMDIEDDLALSVLYLSTKYMLPILQEASRKKLIEILNTSNIWQVYTYAASVEEPELYAACKLYFQGDITPVREALATKEFLNVQHSILLDFLHLNDDFLNIDDMADKVLRENQLVMRDSAYRDCKTMLVDYQNYSGISISEIELFKSCSAWAQAECLRQEIEPNGANRRTMLGECLSLIRFPTMLQEDLANAVYPTGILTQEEVLSLWQYAHRKTDSKCQVTFPQRERQFIVTVPEIESEDLNNVNTTVTLKSESRVVLSRVWTDSNGDYKITVTNLTSKTSWSTQCHSDYHNYRTESKWLFYVDIVPQVLEADTAYSITAEIVKCDYQDLKVFDSEVIVPQLAPYVELKLSNETDGDMICALTLCLV